MCERVDREQMIREIIEILATMPEDMRNRLLDAWEREVSAMQGKDYNQRDTDSDNSTAGLH
ncbi:MAG: hypothetical protein CL607_21305 [Anaerolineaceae bacterium]|nr:hypothetical protein [Anaerolineaceae bacterium]MCA9881428.1 hypothetical protein [Anaerolineae bacterium]MCA9886723.1 hypothetical protein [Anaerolineae bacterium]MCA9891348.1 hypothetical protein [Anaerolineae bacterium]